VYVYIYIYIYIYISNLIFGDMGFNSYIIGRKLHGLKEKEIQELCKGLELNEKKFEERCKEFKS